MAKQNVYDNEVFFEGYRRLRQKEGNANALFETPALFSLLPDLKGKRILDLGCGCGDHCAEFIRLGAASVTAIDISAKMLEAAREQNADPKISYINMPMEDISSLEGGFDIAVSSLAIHYVEDYSGLVRNIHELLTSKGLFVFSQEHPLTSCFSSGERWTKDEKGVKIYANISNYSLDGERSSRWFIDDVKKYHRTFSTVINTLIENGFALEKLVEPLPSPEILEKHPEQADLLHRPDFLLIRASKNK